MDAQTFWTANLLDRGQPACAQPTAGPTRESTELHHSSVMAPPGTAQVMALRTQSTLCASKGSNRFHSGPLAVETQDQHRSGGCEVATSVTWPKFVCCAPPSDWAQDHEDAPGFRTRGRRFSAPDAAESCLSPRPVDALAPAIEHTRWMGRIIRAVERTGVDCDTCTLLKIIDAIAEPLFVKDQRLRIVLVNRAMCDFAGKQPEAMIGQMSVDLVPLEQARRFDRADEQVLATGADVVSEEEVQDAHGRGRLIQVTRRLFSDGHGKPLIVGIITDLTELRDSRCRLENANQRLENLAHRDALTGLMNRAAFDEILRAEIAEGSRAGAGFALLFMGLDGFKRINELYGRSRGDELIRITAARIAALTRSGDILARLGGDEFVVLARDCREGDLVAMAERFAQAANRPMSTSACIDACASISIGIARYPSDGLDADVLLSGAEAARCMAKTSQGARYAFFDVRHGEASTRQRRLDNDLIQDVMSGRIRMVVQPIVRLADSFEQSKVIGYEALARWDHPRGLDVSPDTFIPMAERLNLIGSLGQSVLRQACSFIASCEPGLYVSVNVSSLQLQDERFVDMVWHTLAATGAKPRQLALELTETALTTPAARGMLEALRRGGVAIFIDDFGVGYSNLTRLHELSFDAIKVDRGFVRNIERGGIAASMIKTIASLAVELDVELIAEGIETSTVASALVALGVRKGQGYLYGRPSRPVAARSGRPMDPDA